MKCFLFSPHVDGNEFADVPEVGVVCFNNDMLERLRTIRAYLEQVQEKTGRPTLAGLIFWSSLPRWYMTFSDNAALMKIMVEHQLFQVVGEEPIEDALTFIDTDWVEITNDEYNAILAATNEELRTEADQLVVDRVGLYFTCSDKYTPIIYSTSTLPWWQVFDEPEPQTTEQEHGDEVASV